MTFVQLICYKTINLLLPVWCRAHIQGAVKREEGATPSLSRNCKGVPTSHNATGNTWEGAKKGKSPSQETCHTAAVLEPPWNEGPEPECIQHTHDFEPLPIRRGAF